LTLPEKRIESISLIHEKLYKSKDLTSIDSKEYLVDLLNNIYDSTITDEWQIKITPIIDHIKLNIETTIPLGLLVTEIVTNSLKYAFVDNKVGEIVVELTIEKDICKLIISDTGPGFPVNFKEEKLDSLGWQLIISLSSQLDGKHAIENANGAVHIITFPLHLFEESS
jgi:two-component sensor histidine kinase